MSVLEAIRRRRIDSKAEQAIREMRKPAERVQSRIDHNEAKVRNSRAV